MGTLETDPISSDRFKIRRRLGAGGFGEVYEALDTERSEVVALKTLKRVDADALYRFKKEFRSLADLSHPNLITLHELFSDGSQWFFTMELVDGTDLLSYLRPASNERSGHESSAPCPSNLGEDDTREVSTEASPAPDIARLRSVFAQLAAGVEALHDKGKLHRDIKPSNVLVDRDGRVVLVDFGLVREMESAQSTEHVLGTPAYMAPEQIEGQVTEASDWYAVGVVLFQALTGRLPFEGPALQVLVDKQQSHPPFPSELVTETPDDLSVLCLELLSRDPSKRPTSSAVIEELGDTRTLSNQSPVQAREDRGEELFVGREAELSTLREAFERSRRGAPVVAHVRGRPGIGKTALVERLLEVIGTGAAVILRGRCHEREEVPFKAVDSLVDSLCSNLGRLDRADADALMPRNVRALARLFPVLDRVEAVVEAPGGPADIPDKHELRWRGFRALRELLARISDRAPLVLWIDDIQWSDEDSALLLAELLRPPEAPQLLLVVSYRTGGGEALPKSIEGALEVTESVHVEVSALPRAQATELARSLLPLGDLDALVEPIARESLGDPLFIQKLARYVASEESVTLEASLTLDQVIARQVEALPAESRRVLRLVCVCHRQPVPVPLAMSAADLEPSAREPFELTECQLVRRLGRGGAARLQAFHDRVREHVLRSLEREDLRALHAALAATFEAISPPDHEALAAHHEGAGDSAAAALSLVAAAALAAEKLAFEHAAVLYRRALQLGIAEPSERRLLGRALGDVLVNAGRGAEAADVFLEAMEGADARETQELRCLAATYLLVSGRLGRGLELMKTVLSSVGVKMVTTTGQALVSLLWHRATLRVRGLEFQERGPDAISSHDILRIDTVNAVARGLAMDDVVGSSALQTQALILALDAGEVRRIAWGLLMVAVHNSAAGGSAARRSAEMIRRASEVVDRLQDPLLHVWNEACSGCVAFCEGRFRDSVTLCDDAERHFAEWCTGTERIGLIGYEPVTPRVFAMSSLVYLGELREISDRLPDLLRKARERGDIDEDTWQSVRSAPVVHLAAGDVDEARRVFEDALARWPGQSVGLFDAYAFYHRVQIAIYEEEPELAWAAVHESWPGLHRSLFTHIQVHLVESRYIRASAALACAERASTRSGRFRQMLREASNAARVIERQRMAWSTPFAQRIRAGVQCLSGNTERAVALLLEAEAGFEAGELLMHHAATRLHRGRLIGGEKGQHLVASANQAMADQRVADPARMALALAPGLGA